MLGKLLKYNNPKIGGKKKHLLGSGGGGGVGAAGSSAYVTSATKQPATTASSASLTVEGCSIVHAPFPLYSLTLFRFHFG